LFQKTVDRVVHIMRLISRHTTYNNVRNWSPRFNSHTHCTPLYTTLFTSMTRHVYTARSKHARTLLNRAYLRCSTPATWTGRPGLEDKERKAMYMCMLCRPSCVRTFSFTYVQITFIYFCKTVFPLFDWCLRWLSRLSRHYRRNSKTKLNTITKNKQDPQFRWSRRFEKLKGWKESMSVKLMRNKI
jgi:hypothetical protein